MALDVDVAPGLYRGIRGDDAARLAPVVRAVHVGSATVHGRGTLEVRRAHRLGSVAARWLSLPPAGSVEPLQLAVVRTSGREVWVRLFPDRALVTEQYAGRNGELVERSGRGELRFRLTVDGGRLRFSPIGAAVRLGGVSVPIPRLLAPQVAGSAAASADGSRLVVSFTIGLPLVGTLLTYLVELEPSP